MKKCTEIFDIFQMSNNYDNNQKKTKTNTKHEDDDDDVNFHDNNDETSEAFSVF